MFLYEFKLLSKSHSELAMAMGNGLGFNGILFYPPSLAGTLMTGW